MRLGRLLATALVLAIAGAGALAWLAFTPTATLRAGGLVVDVPAHEGVIGIARRLSDADVIRSAPAFVALAALQGSVRRLKAGEYEIPQGASTAEVLALIASGHVRQHAVLHPEGATVSELARVLESERLAPAADVTRVAADPAFLRSLGIEAPSVEGYLFPDTYQFVRGMTTQEMLGRMVQRLRTKLTPELRERAKARGLDIHRLLTLASIIEREAVVKDEQRLISAVFWNRLRRDLPPGPIASPGLGAIEAAVDPAPVGYLYFVARDDQRHQFSNTVEQHNAAVARYRRLSRR
jgi:UPF0755 protein